MSTGGWGGEGPYYGNLFASLESGSCKLPTHHLEKAILLGSLGSRSFKLNHLCSTNTAAFLGM